MPLLATLVFGTIDAGRAFSIQGRLTNMAREGAFYAQYNPSKITCAAPTPTVASTALGEDSGLSGATVTVTDVLTGLPVPNDCSAAGTPGNRVKVTVSYSMPLLTPLMVVLVGPKLTISSSTVVVVQGNQ
jgi:Flp pilus assembly protein TadG